MTELRFKESILNQNVFSYLAPFHNLLCCLATHYRVRLTAVKIYIHRVRKVSYSCQQHVCWTAAIVCSVAMVAFVLAALSVHPVIFHNFAATVFLRTGQVIGSFIIFYIADIRFQVEVPTT